MDGQRPPQLSPVMREFLSIHVLPRLWLPIVALSLGIVAFLVGLIVSNLAGIILALLGLIAGAGGVLKGRLARQAVAGPSLCGLVFVVLVVIRLNTVNSPIATQKKESSDGDSIAIKIESKAAQPKQPIDPRIAKVQPAVDKGVAFLKAQALNLEPFEVGKYADKYQAVFALMGLALLETGVPADDPAILRVAARVQENRDNRFFNYDLASCLFFLNRWHESRPLEERDRNLARSFALRLINNQLTSGVWAYGGARLSADAEACLLAALATDGPKPHFEGFADFEGLSLGYSMSNTQFAMLALWGARKHDIPVRGALLALADHCHNNQYPDGHWSYYGGPRFYETMCSTCAGLMSLAIEKALLEDKEFVSAPERKPFREKKADLESAFAYVARSIGRKAGDPGGAQDPRERGKLFGADAWGDLYFLWCIERLGMIYGKEKIGDKDWYNWGYPIVLQAQKDDGSWNDKHGRLVDTCFALLFLKKANIAKDLTDKLQSLSMLEPARPGHRPFRFPGRDPLA
jgi:hypothetical protein